MSIFSKKTNVDTVNFWKGKVEYLFSEKFETSFQLLLSMKSELLKDSEPLLIKDHLVAAYVELLNIAIGRNGASRDKRMDILRIQDEFIKELGGKDIPRYKTEYNKRFGSSFEDGVRPMAEYFSKSVKAEDQNKLEEFIYDLFYGVLNDSFNELEKIQLN